MKYINYLLRIVVILLVFVITTSNAAVGGNPKTPYQQLKMILDENYIYKDAITDELTESEIGRISVDVAVQFKVPESVVKNSTTVGEMLTNIMKYKYYGKNSEKWIWKKIQYSSNSNDYVLFMLLYPNSKHYKEASSKFIVTRLYEEYISLAYINSEETDSIYEVCERFLEIYEYLSELYDAYIREYQCGGCDIPCIDYEGFSYINPKEWAEAFKEYLQEVDEERQEWKAALREDTHDAYWNYYIKYPRSETADTAYEKVRKFEQAAWNKALKSNKRDAYEKFIDQFPQGYYSSEAYRKIVHGCLDTISSEANFNDLNMYCDYEHTGYSLICIGNINNKGKSYTITLTGDCGYRMTLKQGEYKWLEVANGDYTILVEADGTTPHWGNVTCDGYVYAQAWLIRKYSSFLHSLPILPIFGGQPNNYQNKEVDKEAEQRFDAAVSAQCPDYERDL